MKIRCFFLYIKFCLEYRNSVLFLGGGVSSIQPEFTSMFY